MQTSMGSNAQMNTLINTVNTNQYRVGTIFSNLLPKYSLHFYFKSYLKTIS